MVAFQFKGKKFHKQLYKLLHKDAIEGEYNLTPWANLVVVVQNANDGLKSFVKDF